MREQKKPYLRRGKQLAERLPKDPPVEEGVEGREGHREEAHQDVGQGHVHDEDVGGALEGLVADHGLEKERKRFMGN